MAGMARHRAEPTYCIDPNGGYSRSLVKLMHKQRARALAHEPSECVSALAKHPAAAIRAAGFFWLLAAERLIGRGAFARAMRQLRE
jgi:hypothetical protein